MLVLTVYFSLAMIMRVHCITHENTFCIEDRGGRRCMVVCSRSTTTCAIIAYHH